MTVPPSGRARRAGDSVAAWTVAALAAAVALALAGTAALLWSAWSTGMDPTAHVYPAMVWAIIVWTVGHIGAGVIMQLYCLGSSLLGKLTPRYDAELQNVTLFWHFMAVTVLVGALTIGAGPRLM